MTETDQPAPEQTEVARSVEVVGASMVFNEGGPGRVAALDDVDLVVEPGDFIHRETMARVFSLLVTGDDGLQGQLIPIIKRATEGGGLDLATTKALLRKELGEFDIDYESYALGTLEDRCFVIPTTR